jgi:hypothetical protein
LAQLKVVCPACDHGVVSAGRKGEDLVGIPHIVAVFLRSWCRKNLLRNVPKVIPRKKAGIE